MELPVSPASPEKAIKVWLLSCFVLSSEALSMVAPLIWALDVAIMVKSLPVKPSRTSLDVHISLPVIVSGEYCPYMFAGWGSWEQPQHEELAVTRVRASEPGDPDWKVRRR